MIRARRCRVEGYRIVVGRLGWVWGWMFGETRQLVIPARRRSRLVRWRVRMGGKLCR